MTTDIWRDFDPNLEPPVELKNVVVKPTSPDGVDAPPGEEFDAQTETIDDEDSELEEDYSFEVLEPPSEFVILSQTVRTAPDGTQVVDVVIEIEDMPGAVDYQPRITKA